MAVPAVAAFWVPEPASEGQASAQLEPASPAAPVPDWLPELAQLLACGDDLASLPSPPPEAWIPDTRRTEESSGSAADS